jgi:hypothetical protein
MFSIGLPVDLWPKEESMILKKGQQKLHKLRQKTESFKNNIAYKSHGKYQMSQIYYKKFNIFVIGIPKERKNRK